ncbi:MAG: tetratricopeptide repeat protein [Candidatus Omnitrophota bacterium]|jgi:Ca-activated chloride channel family protein
MKPQRLKVLLMILMSCLVIQSACAAENDRTVSKANVLYQQHKYDEAKQLYEKALSEHPESAAISYNLGAALFKSGDYTSAVKSFEKGLTVENKTLEFQSQYNIANSKFKAGMLKKNDDATAAVQFLNESLENYKRAIDLNPHDEDAKINYEFVDKVLKEMKNKMQENKQDQQKEGESKEDKDKDKGTGAGKESRDSKKDKQSGAGDQEEKRESSDSEGQDKKDTQGSASEKHNNQENIPEKKEQENDARASDGSGEPDSKELSSKEAAMLLDGYRQEENTQGQLQDKDLMYQEEVVKDW